MEENPNNEDMTENVMQIENISDVEYSRSNIAFVIKPLHIVQANRWARWCSDRGFGKRHDKAFALAMDILEGRTKQLISEDNRLETLERLIYTHDDLLSQILQEIALSKQKDEEETEEEKTIRRVREKRAMMEASKNKKKVN